MISPSGISHIAMLTADLDAFRAFYEDTVGLETIVVFGAGFDHVRQAVVVAGEVMLHVFEIVDYDPSAQGYTSSMFQRGRLDHFGFRVGDEGALAAVRDRLFEVGASSGDIRRLGPMLSVRFHDPEGFEGEISCFDPTYDPSTMRDEDEIVDANWLELTRHLLQAGPALSPSRRSEP